MLEGALTWTSIRDHWQNTINAYCKRDESTRRFCDWARETISANFVTIKEYAATHSRHDHYWHQINLFCWQLEGLATGWRSGVARSREELEMDLSEFLMLNAAADLPDMRIYYENIVNPSTEYEYHSTPVKASMLVKFLFGNDGGERPDKVLLGHSSDGSYASMLRVHKKYKFHFHHTSSSATNREVFGVDIAFTGYPGALASSDDFYIVNGGYTKLSVAGIRIENNNLDLWNRVDVTRAILLSARVMAANRLAHSGRSWAKLMALNSSFGTKQWIVIDVKRIHNETSIANQELTVEPLPVNGVSDGFAADAGSTSDKPELVAVADDAHQVPRVRSRNGAVWIIDQLPGRLYGEDMTKEIVYEDGFWTGNGIPYFEETRQLSNIDDTAAAKKSVLKVANANITDLDAVSKVLKSRAYRGDLMGANATAFGNIDIKLFSETSTGKMVFRALAGPVYYKPQATTTTVADTTATTSTSSTTQPLIDEAINNDNKDDKSHDDDDDSLVNDDGQLEEIDVFSERRLVRGDFRAAAMVNSNGPFRWSNAKVNHHGEHVGHPDVWNFDAVSPTWAWKHDTI